MGRDAQLSHATTPRPPTSQTSPYLVHLSFFLFKHFLISLFVCFSGVQRWRDGLPQFWMNELISMSYQNRAACWRLCVLLPLGGVCGSHPAVLLFWCKISNFAFIFILFLERAVDPWWRVSWDILHSLRCWEHEDRLCLLWYLWGGVERSGGVCANQGERHPRKAMVGWIGCWDLVGEIHPPLLPHVSAIFVGQKLRCWL